MLPPCSVAFSSQLLIFIQFRSYAEYRARKDAYKAAKVLDTCATQGDTHHEPCHYCLNSSTRRTLPNHRGDLVPHTRAHNSLSGNLTIIGQHSRKSVEVVRHKPNEMGGGFHNDPHENYQQATLLNTRFFFLLLSFFQIRWC